MRTLHSAFTVSKVALGLCLAVAVGCGDGAGGTTPPASDVGGNDLGGADSGDPDTGAQDTGAAPIDSAPEASVDDVPGDTGAAPDDVPVDAPAPGDVLPPGHCSSSADCAGSSAPACNTMTMRCVACTTAMDTCPAAQHCDPASNSCIAGCRSDEGCAGGDGGAGRSRCDTMTHSCVECTETAQCGAGRLCVGSVCVAGCNATAPCPSGQACCTGACVDTATNLANCGACDQRCTTANATPACTNGACAIDQCMAPYANCDMMATNGCEVDTATTLAHCGRCGNACATRPRTVTACTAGACTYVCEAGFADCNNNPADGCEVNLNSDAAHCGTCTTACNPPGGVGACAMGRCTVASCTTGFADCNMNPADGREIDTRTSATHCGMCGRACMVGANAVPNCVAGACRTTCAAGFSDCDGNDANGCEVDTRVNVTHCGSCGRTCTAVGGTPACVGSLCSVGTCMAGLGNCDMNVANGCETDIRATVAHCGVCGNACPVRAAAAATCTGGTCGFTCNAGFGNCDAMVANGCETNTNTTVTHCGRCANACSFANGMATCVAGACTLGTCNTGFANCNANQGDGCEAVLSRITTAPMVLRRFAPAGGGMDQTPSENISVAVGPNGEVFVLSYSDKIIVFDAGGTFLRALPMRGGWGAAYDIAVDPVGGDIWLVTPGNNRIYRLNAAGVPIGDFAAGSGSRGIAYHAGEVYYGDLGNNRVIVTNPAGVTQRMITGNGLNQPRGIAVGASRNVYVANYGDNTARVFTAAGALVRSFAVIGNPTDIAVDECRGVVYVLGESSDAWAAYRLDGTRLYTVPMPGATSHMGIAVNADGSRLYVSFSHGAGRSNALYQF